MEGVYNRVPPPVGKQSRAELARHEVIRSYNPYFCQRFFEGRGAATPRSVMIAAM